MAPATILAIISRLDSSMRNDKKPIKWQIRLNDKSFYYFTEQTEQIVANRICNSQKACAPALVYRPSVFCPKI